MEEKKMMAKRAEKEKYEAFVKAYHGNLPLEFAVIGDTLVRISHIAVAYKRKGSIIFDFHMTPVEEYGLILHGGDLHYEQAEALYDYIQDNLIINKEEETAECPYVLDTCTVEDGELPIVRSFYFIKDARADSMMSGLYTHKEEAESCLARREKSWGSK